MKNNEKLEKKYYLDMDKQFQIKDVYCINKKKITISQYTRNIDAS